MQGHHKYHTTKLIIIIICRKSLKVSNWKHGLLVCNLLTFLYGKNLMVKPMLSHELLLIGVPNCINNLKFIVSTIQFTAYHNLHAQ